MDDLAPGNHYSPSEGVPPGNLPPDHCGVSPTDLTGQGGRALKIRTAVDADLRAFHTDPTNDPSINEGRHEHVWNVQLIYEGDIFRDARCFRAALLRFLEDFQGKDLPWWSAEDIAKAVLTIGTGDPIACVVTRPGYRAEVWR